MKLALVGRRKIKKMLILQIKMLPILETVRRITMGLILFKLDESKLQVFHAGRVLELTGTLILAEMFMLIVEQMEKWKFARILAKILGLVIMRRGQVVK
jgi:hypothetical protein